MSILKGILHHWNKTNSAYDTIHPETESAQITDWHSGIMSSLASKTLGTVVDAITTDSVLGKLIKMLLNASGVRYLIDTNGYICFGSFFGGLIIQWGIATGSIAEAHISSRFDVTLPINYQKQIAQVWANVLDGGYYDSWEGITVWVQGETVKSFIGYMVAGRQITYPPKIRWITLGE